MNPRAHLEKAIALDPKYPKAYYSLGLLNKKEGNDNEALENFKQAVSIDKDFAEAQCELAISLMKKDELDEARNHFLKLIL